jgi:hypothetical protein
MRPDLDHLSLGQLGTVVLLASTQASRLGMGTVSIGPSTSVRLRVGHV